MEGTFLKSKGMLSLERLPKVFLEPYIMFTKQLKLHFVAATEIKLVCSGMKLDIKLTHCG